MNNITNSTGTYWPANDPRLEIQPNRKTGSGILKATIYVYSRMLCNEMPLERMLAYSWIETVNGIELEIEKPFLVNASAIEEDIINSLKAEHIKFDIINFLTQKL